VRAYLDASVLIAYLYGEMHAPDLIPAYTLEEFLVLPPGATDDHAGSERGGG